MTGEENFFLKLKFFVGENKRFFGGFLLDIKYNIKHRLQKKPYIYLVSSLNHSKSGVGTAEAAHLSETCRPVADSLLLDSVIVGASDEENTHTHMLQFSA